MGIDRTGTTRTQYQVAQMLGVSQATVSRLMWGQRGPSLELMEKIKEAFGWSLDEQAAALADGTYGRKLRDRAIKTDG